MTFKYRIAVAAALLLFVSTLFAAAPALAQGDTDEGLTGRSYYNVNIRTTPGTNRPIIGTVAAGSEFVAIGRDESNSWVQVESGETTGWSAAWLFVFEEDTIDLPVTTDVEAPLASGPGPFEALVPFTMNLRAAPTTESAVVLELPYLSDVSVVARDDTNSWVKVEYRDEEGWLALWLIVLLGDINALPISDDIVVASATPTQGPSPTGITVSAPYTVNMRTEPRMDAPVVIELPFAVEGNAVARNEGSNWILVDYGGEQGWVARWLVRVSDNFAGLPVEDDSEDAVPTIEDTITAQAQLNLVIRASPGGEQYAPLGQVTAGQTIEPLARTEDSQYLRVSVEGTDGWIAAWPLVANADLNLLPVEEPLP